MCGVGDYSRNLADELAQHHSISSKFIVVSRKWQQDLADHHPCHALLHRQQSCLHDLLATLPEQNTGILLQYSGYGYSNTNTPWWLLRALKAIKRPRPDLPLMIMFHELAARGSPLNKSFWLYPVQFYLLREIAKLAQGVVTNRESYARTLAPWINHPPAVLPVFSNLGESSCPLPFGERENQMIVFGWEMTGSVRESFVSSIRAAVRLTGVKRLVFIRHPIDHPLLEGLEIVSHPTLPAEEISAILQRTRFGFLPYNPRFLGKSGIAAAYAAHGVVPILTEGQGHFDDGLNSGVQCISLKEAMTFPHLNPAVFQALSTNIYAWYKKHDLCTTGKIYANLVQTMLEA